MANGDGEQADKERAEHPEQSPLRSLSTRAAEQRDERAALDHSITSRRATANTEKLPPL